MGVGVHRRVFARVLPTLIAGDDDDPDVDPYDVLEMSMPTEMLVMLRQRGITLQDVLDGKVLDLDHDEIIAQAMDETGSHVGRWSPFE